MKTARFMLAAAAASMTTMPVLAAPASLSVAQSARVGSATAKDSDAVGGGLLAALIAAGVAAIVVIVAVEDDDPDSP